MLLQLYIVSVSFMVVSPTYGDVASAASSSASSPLGSSASGTFFAAGGRAGSCFVVPHNGCGKAVLLRGLSSPAAALHGRKALGAPMGKSDIRRSAVTSRMSGKSELPKPVTSPFPLWDENVMQTLGLINPDDAKVWHLSPLRSPRNRLCSWLGALCR